MQSHTEALNSGDLFSIPVNFIEEPSLTGFDSMQKNSLVDLKGNTEKINKQCRICLQGQQQGNIISPCKCTGSVSYTHTKCLIQWIKRKVQINFREKARCQLCDTEFNYRVSNVRIFDCEQLSRNYKKQKKSLRCFAVVYILFTIIFVASLGLLVAAALNAQNGLIKQILVPNNTTVVIYVSIIILYLIIMIVVAVLFISEYVVREQIAITEVFNHKQKTKFIKNFKVYFRR